MTKRKCQKDKQRNNQTKRTEGQATQWPKEKGRRTSNTMTKIKGQKEKQHNDQKKRPEGQATQ